VLCITKKFPLYIFYCHTLFGKLTFLVLEIFHKYDGFIYPKPAGGVSWVLSSGPEINDRRASFRTFFPKWRGFYVNSFDTIIQPAEALHSLECLVEGTSASRISTSGDIQRRTVDSQKLRLDEVGVTNL
jgi:hypothetical protein